MSAAALPPVYVLTEKAAVFSVCSEQMCARLKEFGVDLSRIIQIPDVSYLVKLSGSQKSATLIVPGGSTCFLTGQMTETKAIEALRKTIAAGWNYFGSCSGGNAACSNLSISIGKAHTDDFEEFSHYELLHLLPIRAHSPAYPVNKSLFRGGENARMITVLSEQTKKKLPVIWCEGSTFTPEEGATGLQLEASYTDLSGNPGCAYSGKFGKGTVVISAVHPELDLDSPKKDEKTPLHELIHRFFQLTVPV